MFRETPYRKNFSQHASRWKDWKLGDDILCGLFVTENPWPVVSMSKNGTTTETTNCYHGQDRLDKITRCFPPLVVVLEKSRNGVWSCFRGQSRLATFFKVFKQRSISFPVADFLPRYERTSVRERVPTSCLRTSYRIRLACGAYTLDFDSPSVSTIHGSFKNHSS